MTHDPAAIGNEPLRLSTSGDPTPSMSWLAFATGFVVGGIGAIVREIQMEWSIDGVNESAIQKYRGATRERILKRFGHPPATIGVGRAAADDTWYFPLSSERQAVLVIQFIGDRASSLEIIEMPTPQPMSHAAAS